MGNCTEPVRKMGPCVVSVVTHYITTFNFLVPSHLHSIFRNCLLCIIEKVAVSKRKQVRDDATNDKFESILLSFL